MSCPGHIKLTLTAVVIFSCLIRTVPSYLLAGKARKRKSSENEGEDEAEDKGGEEGHDLAGDEGGEEGDASEETEEGGVLATPAPADE